MQREYKPHLGKNISFIRELREMKQSTLAMELGISQQSVSSIENSAEISEERLEQIANVLAVDKQVIINLSKQHLLNQIVENVQNSSTLHFNAVEKIIELYERLLIAEKHR
ncbi:MAG: transcriptional regulator [Zunongwangia sp.]|uniref:Transcriptional regulator n=1 Tax=Zunongwangia profunda TaxID=398743 RepID=A0A3D5IZA8_9FLAO|nr:transcriptional regulator [Zunongwangia sp.]HCV81225.1 transcriptional regulator [Zunongwangia profunda]|tara:strand:- start:7051 stop:7383 length:333 start_codon:yes stop_codon:yes gene_type:complete